MLAKPPAFNSLHSTHTCQARTQLESGTCQACCAVLTQDFTRLSSMLAKRILCPSCSLIQRRVLEKKLVAMWLSKLTLAFCAAVFKICSRTLPQFRLCNVHDNILYLYIYIYIALTHFRKVATVQNSRLLKMWAFLQSWFLVICWQALTVQSIVRGCQTWISCFVELLCQQETA